MTLTSQLVDWVCALANQVASPSAFRDGWHMTCLFPLGATQRARGGTMIAHTSLAVRNFAAAKKFYQKALAPLGYAAKMEADDAAGFNDGKNTDFWIGES